MELKQDNGNRLNKDSAQSSLNPMNTAPSFETPINDTSEERDKKHEEVDPNKIHVTISDPKTPVVVLFGPPACGKTMTLIRLARYLHIKGYTIEPDTEFREKSDTSYQHMCNEFIKMLDKKEKSGSTALIDFMLVKIRKDGKPICQILEGPGELYFDPQKPETGFSTYLYEVINAKNPKIWAIMVEPGTTTQTMGQNERVHYINKIRELNTKIDSKDKVMIVFNKIDVTSFVKGKVKVIPQYAKNEIKNIYPGLFDLFKNGHPITSFWKPYLCTFVPFSTGSYNGEQYIESDERFPKMLWNKIRGVIKGW